MGGVGRPDLCTAGVRLAAIGLLLICLLNVALSTSAPALAATCAGDEQILLAPATPLVGGLLMVAAFSRVGHEQAILLGPGGPLPVERVAIGDRFVWQGMVALDHPGEHVFAFGVANGASPLSTCADAIITVAEQPTSPLVASLNPFDQSVSETTAQRAPAAAPDVDADALDTAPAENGDDATPSSPRRSTRTPTPRPDNENENGNDNDAAPTRTPTRTPTSTRVPTATRTPKPAATDTPEPTPTLGPASISSLAPSRPICGQPLTIRGERFGNDRGDVDGRVRIDGRDASIDAWDMDEIAVSVPQSARGGNSRLLEVIVSGRTATKEIAITC